MDFFEHQVRAKRKSFLLLIYFVLTVVSIVLCTHVAGTIILAKSSDAPILPVLLNFKIFTCISLITLSFILGGSLYRIFQLRRGGEFIALALGGEELSAQTSGFHETKLKNIVEEMALASGTPIPRIFVLQGEESINAFAAGYSKERVVIGVTRGCMRCLNRSELQGVIAHEFSHILHGDMSLNTRLIGLIGGITSLSSVGYFIIRLVGQSSSKRSSSSSKKGKDGSGAFILFGLALVIIGALGALGAKLIQSAISRQREFLADASAVQFTRNPDGVSNALKKIGGLSEHGKVESTMVENASHMFFCNALKKTWIGWLATHPPLEERIRRIDPYFDGAFPGDQEIKNTSSEEEELQRSFEQSTQQKNEEIISYLNSNVPPRSIKFKTNPEKIISHSGKPSAEHLEYAHYLLYQIPSVLREKSKEIFSARSIIYGLLIQASSEQKALAAEILKKQEQPACVRDVETMLPLLEKLNPLHKLPLVELCLPTLRELSLPQYQQFLQNLNALIAADTVTSLFEYSLLKLLKHHLNTHFYPRGETKTIYRRLSPLLPHVIILLSMLAHLQSQYSEEAFSRGVSSLNLKESSSLKLLPTEKLNLEIFDKALDQVALAQPLLKSQVINACAHVIVSNQEVNAEEFELLRTITNTLQGTMPPLIEPFVKDQGLIAI